MASGISRKGEPEALALLLPRNELAYAESRLGLHSLPPLNDYLFPYPPQGVFGMARRS